MDVHELAEALATGMDDPETPSWTIHDSLADGGKAHRDEDTCWAYVTIDGTTYSLTVQAT